MEARMTCGEADRLPCPYCGATDDIIASLRPRIPTCTADFTTLTRQCPGCKNRYTVELYLELKAYGIPNNE